MKVLIIGGTGNISRDFAELLIARGASVAVANRGNSPAPAGCEQIRIDRTNEKDFARQMEDVRADCAVDFLCFDPAQCQAALDALGGRIGQYVFISSATVYRKPHETLPLTEETPQGNRFSLYARNKIACEAYLRETHGADFPVTIVRPSHTFSHSWIPSPLYGSADYTIAARIEAGRPIVVHGDGQSLWTLTAASDFAAGLAGLLGNPAALGEAFHITSDEALTWNCIYQEIGRALGREPVIENIATDFLCKADATAEAKLLGDKAEHGVFDNAKIKRFVPDFACAKSFRTAIRESVAWYRQDAARMRIDEKQDRVIEATLAKWRESRAL